MRLYISSLINVSIAAILLTSVVGAQTEAKTASQTDETDHRVKQLETQLQKMQSELESLKRLLGKPAVAARNIDQPGTVQAEETAAIASNKPDRPSAKKDLSIDVGNYKITPYGTIFFNVFGNSSGTNNSDDPLWATPGGKSNVSASGRQTRLGLRIAGGRLGKAAVTGVVETDFYGGFPSVGVGENMGVLRLRIAKAQFDWERTSVTVGQDWIVFAPNNPTSLAAAAIPQFAAAGNLWSRLPQVRIEQKLGKNIKWQGAILAPGTGDFPTTGTPALLQPSSGAASKVPFFQGRLTYSTANWSGTKKTGTIGIAGHYGRSNVTVGNASREINSAGIAADWNFPLHKRLNLVGEAFYGHNLGGFQGGIFQGYNTDFAFLQDNTLVAGGMRAIETHGGWTQLSWNVPAFNDRLSMYASFGIDDPTDEDLVSLSGREFRKKNVGFAFDAIYKVTPDFQIGWEFRRLQTYYLIGGRSDTNHMNLAAAYSF